MNKVRLSRTGATDGFAIGFGLAVTLLVVAILGYGFLAVIASGGIPAICAISALVIVVACTLAGAIWGEP